MARTDLYGGALTADIPRAATDVSTARPVPDHQEVFADAGRDQSIVFEIVVCLRAGVRASAACRWRGPRQKKRGGEVAPCTHPFSTPTTKQEHDATISDADAAAFYWADQATQNEAVSSELGATAAPALDDAVPLLATAASPHLAGAAVLTATGTQAAAKGRQAGLDAVNTVDVALAVLRLPAVDSDVLVVVNTATAVGAGSAAAGAGAVGRAGSTGAAPGDSAALLGRVLASLAILDWGLFG